MAFDTSDIILAMKIIAQSEVASLNLDKTIIAQIVEIINLETGEYKVKYEGNTFSVFSANPTVTYEKGNSVYVKIPQNDMSQKKFIEGISSDEKTLSDVVEQQTDVVQRGPTWDEFYNYEFKKEFGVCAGLKDTNHINFLKYIYPNSNTPKAHADDFFQYYSSRYKKIRISASFLTRFIQPLRMENFGGNYGIIVTFKTNTVGGNNSAIGSASQVDRVSYRLDMRNFVGEPYKYNTWSPQSVIIDVQDKYLLGLESIMLFQENFGGMDIDDKGRTHPNIPDILVKDIELSFVDLIDLTKDVYYLNIVTREGTVFAENISNLPLEGSLKYKGKNLMAENNCECHWFKRNPASMLGETIYNKIAGPSWEEIKGKFNKLSIGINEVPYHQDYKLVVIYNGTITLTDEVTLSNYRSSYNLSIMQETDIDKVYLKIQNNISGSTKKFKGDWYYLLPDGSYDKIATRQPRIQINDYLIYNVIDFYCQVYDGSTAISTEHFRVKSTESNSDVAIVYRGQGLYPYNANGDLAFEDTEVDRTLQAEVQWEEGVATAYSISWWGPSQNVPDPTHPEIEDWQLISDSRTTAYSPDNSMLENIWVDSHKILHYNIKQKYTLSNYRNTIKINIDTVDQRHFEFKKEILFLKDGDQGTNGSTYVCAIRPVVTSTNNSFGGNIGDRDILLRTLTYNTHSGTWGNRLTLKCFLYHNGELINNNSQYEQKYIWSCGSKKSNALALTYVPGKDDWQYVNGGGTLDTKGDYVVKVTIRVRHRPTNTNNTNSTKWEDKETELYCQYPISIAVDGLDPLDLDTNLPSYVKYTAAGLRPVYQKDQLYCKKKGTNDYATLTSTNKKLFDIEDNYLRPVDKFLYREGIAAIKCVFSDGKMLIHPVMMYINTYGNETINGWDGTKLELNQDKGYLLAPQVGAGKKDVDNTFTGVLMGRQSNIAGEDNDVFGLYGYLKGQSTFGFKENGTAYIGPSGKGQLIFDGNDGVIKSGNYDGKIYNNDNKNDGFMTTSSGTTGMKIDLSEGFIDAYNFYLSSSNMILNSQKQQFLFQIGTKDRNSCFRICSTSNTDIDKILFNVESGKYYLQTEDFLSESNIDKTKPGKDKPKGTKIDLSGGKITSYDFTIKTPYMELTSAETGKFTFDTGAKKGSFVIKSEGKNLLNISTTSGNENNYYLQTKDYVQETNSVQGVGTRIDLEKGRITSYNFQIKTPKFQIESNGGKGKFVFDVSGDGGSFEIKNGSNSLFNVSGGSSGKFFLQTNDFSTTNETGTKIDLKTGRITSYNFQIKTPYLEVDSNNGTKNTDKGKGKFVFNVAGKGTFQIKNNEKILLNVSGNGNYFLKTNNFENEDKNLNKKGTGTKIDLEKGRIISYDFQIKTPHLEINSNNGNNEDDKGKGRFVFDVTGGGRFEIKDSTFKEKNTLFLINGDGTYYLQSINYNGETMLEKLEGVHINLKTGEFDVGGSGRFRGKLYSTSGKIGGWTIDERGLKNEDNTIYLRNNGSMKVKDNFSVDTSGNLTCDGGFIGGWEINTDSLSQGSTTLSSANGITTNSITIKDGSKFGTLGVVEGLDGNRNPTYNIGITSTDSSKSVILESANNVALNANKHVLLQPTTTIFLGRDPDFFAKTTSTIIRSESLFIDCDNIIVRGKGKIPAYFT